MMTSIDPGLKEYSVVFTDRSLNHMSAQFQQTMRELHQSLCDTYRAASCVLIPGGGSYGMEAVARQFGRQGRNAVIRNGWFSYRWTQIFEAIAPDHAPTVLKANRQDTSAQSAFSPVPLDEVLTFIQEHKPACFFAAHVETAAGLMLPDDYIRAIGAAVQENGGLFVLDCVASGAIWIDMEDLNVDVLLTAPQKGWSSTPSAGIVMLRERALDQMTQSKGSGSFVVDLAKWHQIMQAYLDGGHAYHATMPTDGLVHFQKNLQETFAFGLENAKAAQQELGQRVRTLLEGHGFESVSAKGFQAPSVVVSFAPDDHMKSGKWFAERGMQIAAGVPLALDEGPDYRSFRIGLFGLDKLKDVPGTVSHLAAILET